MSIPSTGAAPVSPRAAKAPYLPGDPGIWLFVAGDVLVFSAMFLVYSFYRSADPTVFATSQQELSQTFGLVNTVLLLTSSWFVMLAVRGARAQLTAHSTGFFALALICGAAFIASKAFEYSQKINHGISMLTNDFFMFYFVLTGIHGLHVIVGMGGLGYVIYRSRKATYDAADIRVFESGATFWHMVDLLWIVLFPLLYLVP